jgi:hypothetical protein
MRNLLNILDHLSLSYSHLYDMWDSVERGDFDDAMYCQFYHLFHKDSYTENLNALSREDLALFYDLAKIPCNT